MSANRPPVITINTSASGSNYRNIHVITSEAEKAKQILESEGIAKLTASELAQIATTLAENSNGLRSQAILSEVEKKLKTEELNPADKFFAQAQCAHHYANHYRETDQDDAAIASYLEALDELKIAYQFGLNEEKYHECYYDLAKDLGIAYLKKEDFVSAIPIFEQAIEEANRLKKQGRIPSVTSYCGLAKVSSKISDEMIKEGFKLIDEARALYPADQHTTSLDYASNWYHKGLAYERTDQYQKAAVDYEEALRLRKLIIGESKMGTDYYHSRVGDVHAGLGRVYVYLKIFDQAKLNLDLALQSFTQLKLTKKIEAIQGLLTLTSLLVQQPKETKEMKKTNITDTSFGAFQGYVDPGKNSQQEERKQYRPQ